MPVNIDMFNKAPQVLLLSQPQQVFVYHGVKKRLTQLRSLLFGGEHLDPNQLHNVDHILYDFIVFKIHHCIIIINCLATE